MEPPLRGFQLGHDAGRVIGAEFLVTHAAGPGSYSVVGGFEAHGSEAGWVVWADGGGDEEEEGGGGGADAEGCLGADHRGPEVEGVASLAVWGGKWKLS